MQSNTLEMLIGLFVHKETRGRLTKKNVKLKFNHGWGREVNNFLWMLMHCNENYNFITN